MIQINIKKLHPDAVIPKYAKEGDAGLDLTAISLIYNVRLDVYEVSTGLAIELPKGYVGLLFPRSSIYKTGASLSNAVGVLDSGYKGEIKAMFRHVNSNVDMYKVGDRCIQLVVLPFPEVKINEVNELNLTNDRGGGFGHTGK